MSSNRRSIYIYIQNKQLIRKFVKCISREYSETLCYKCKENPIGKIRCHMKMRRTRLTFHVRLQLPSLDLWLYLTIIKVHKSNT